MAFVVFNTRLNLRFRLAQNNKSQHNVLAFEPAEREGLSSLRSDIGGLHIKKTNAGASPLIIFHCCRFGCLGLFHDPFWGDSGSKAMPLRGNGFCCFEYSLEPSVQTRTKQQKPAQLCWLLNLRRERDSNPRTCDSQRFSRPPHSTALPSLRRKSKTSKPKYEEIIEKHLKTPHCSLITLPTDEGTQTAE